jgi:hypothetical protein
MTMKQVILSAVILGCVAGAVVWYLERFQERRWQDYLQHWAEFRQYEEGHGGN